MILDERVLSKLQRSCATIITGGSMKALMMMKLSIFSLAVLLAACQNANMSPAQDEVRVQRLPPERADITYTGEDSHALAAAAEMRILPTDAERIDAPFTHGEKQMPNHKATLRLGMRFFVESTEGDWSRVVAKDGLNGWLRSDVLVPLNTTTEATVLTDVPAHTGPSTNTPLNALPVPVGELLLVLKHQDGLAQVAMSAGAYESMKNPPLKTVWVPDEALVYDTGEVMVSHQISKVRWSEANGSVLASYYSTLDKAQRAYSNSQLLQVLDRVIAPTLPLEFQ